jgi:hypothetical protein
MDGEAALRPGVETPRLVSGQRIRAERKLLSYRTFVR